VSSDFHDAAVLIGRIAGIARLFYVRPV